MVIGWRQQCEAAGLQVVCMEVADSLGQVQNLRQDHFTVLYPLAAARPTAI